MNVKLVVVGGDVKTSEVELQLPGTIGRGRGASIVLPHPLISRHHCELFESDGRVMVRDMGSLNGTFINNERVTEAALPPGELLTVGTVTFRAVYEMDEAVASESSKSTVKRDTGDKTVHVAKVSTLAVGPKRPAPQPVSEKENTLSGNGEFGPAILPGDEQADDQAGQGSVNKTERLKSSNTKPLQPAAEQNDKPDDDDDLGDFLDSLGKK